MLHHGPIVGCRSGAANVASVFRVVVTLSLVMVGCLTGHSAESLDSNRNKKVFDGNLGSVSSSGGAPSQFLDGSQILRRERHWVRSASSPNRGADIPDFKRLRIHPVPLPQRIQGFRTTNRVHGPPQRPRSVLRSAKHGDLTSPSRQSAGVASDAQPLHIALNKLRSARRGLQARGGGIETHRVTWVGGHYWVLALAPRVLIPSGATNASDPALGGPLFPPGMRSYDQLQELRQAPRSLYLESHAAACARVGLIPTGEHVSLGLPPGIRPDGQVVATAGSAPGWSTSFAAAVARGLGLPLSESPVGGCCTPALYCGAPPRPGRSEIGAGADAGAQCAAHSFGGTRYSNTGWFTDTSRRPVYTCGERNATTGLLAASSSSGGSAIISQSVFVPPVGGNSSLQHPEILSLSADRGGASALQEFDLVSLEGLRLGDDPRQVDVTLGNRVCSSPAICHRTCQSCSQPADCDSNRACVAFGQQDGSVRRLCVPLCSERPTTTSQLCACGQQCRTFDTSSSPGFISLCVNPDVDDQGICPRGRSYPPSVGDSAVDCWAPGGQCAQEGILPAVLRRDSLPSTGTLLAASPPSPETLSQQLGGSASTAAAVGSLERASVRYAESSGGGSSQCNNDADCQSGADVCTAVRCIAGCCVAGSSGRCDTEEPEDVGVRLHDALVPVPLPRVAVALLPMPGPVLVGEGPSDVRLAVSDVDDSPMALFPGTMAWNGSQNGLLPPFAPPFFARRVEALWVGSNGFMSRNGTHPCDGHFGGFQCGPFNRYRDSIAPFLSDWNPSVSTSAEVWARAGIAAAGTPGGFSQLNITSSSPLTTRDAACVAWRRVPEFGRSVNVTWTFTACLFPDGGVRYRFDGLPPQRVPLVTEFVSGLRDEIELDVDARAAGTAILRHFVGASGTAGEAAALAGDFSILGASDALVDQEAIRQNSTVAVCQSDARGCMSRRCGRGGDVIALQWAGLRCGTGLGTEAVAGAFADEGDEEDLSAGVLCKVGAAVAPAKWTRRPTWGNIEVVRAGERDRVLQQGIRLLAGEIECEVPPLAEALGGSPGSAVPAWATANRSILTVAVSLVLPLPVSREQAELALANAVRNGSGWYIPPGDGGAEGAGAGVGISNDVLVPIPNSSTLWSGDIARKWYHIVLARGGAAGNQTASGEAVLGMEVSVLGVLASDNTTIPSSINRSAPQPSRRSRRLQAVLPTVPSAAPAVVDYGLLQTHQLMYTYDLEEAGLMCGCDLDGTTSCDDCGVCGGGGRFRDCNGDCFGTAEVDSCGICAGGRTGTTVDSEVDCNGICWGPGLNCPSPTPSPSPAAQASPSPVPSPSPTPSPVPSSADDDDAAPDVLPFDDDLFPPLEDDDEPDNESNGEQVLLTVIVLVLFTTSLIMCGAYALVQCYEWRAQHDQQVRLNAGGFDVGEYVAGDGMLDEILALLPHYPFKTTDADEADARDGRSSGSADGETNQEGVDEEGADTAEAKAGAESKQLPGAGASTVGAAAAQQAGAAAAQQAGASSSAESTTDSDSASGISPNGGVSIGPFADGRVLPRNRECPISLEDFEDGHDTTLLPCGHCITYHLGLNYFQQATKCPLCRADTQGQLAAANGVDLQESLRRQAQAAMQAAQVAQAADAADNHGPQNERGGHGAGDHGVGQVHEGDIEMTTLGAGAEGSTRGGTTPASEGAEIGYAAHARNIGSSPMPGRPPSMQSREQESSSMGGTAGMSLGGRSVSPRTGAFSMPNPIMNGGTGGGRVAQVSAGSTTAAISGSWRNPISGSSPSSDAGTPSSDRVGQRRAPPGRSRGGHPRVVHADGEGEHRAGQRASMPVRPGSASASVSSTGSTVRPGQVVPV